MRRNWRTILFNDESRFTIKFSDGGLRVWRLVKVILMDQWCKLTVLEVVVWLCREEFISGERQIWLLYGKMNWQRYCVDSLRPVVIPFMNRHNRFVFKQDNAKPHTARLTANFLQTNNVNTYLGQVAHPILPKLSIIFMRIHTNNFSLCKLTLNVLVLWNFFMLAGI